jgi:LysM domain-containing protein
MLRIISALLIIFSSLCFSAGAVADDTGLELSPDAPDRHVVVAGDTLWGIASKFLKDPYRWTELWKLNADDVKNPHRIYPGQVIVLDRTGTEPQLRLETIKVQPQVRIDETRQAIPAIPQQVIEPFLTQPLVADASALDGAPRIVAIKEDRVIAGSGDVVYALGGKSDTKLWQVFRPGKALVDPDTKEVLGFEAILLGTASLVQQGDPAVFQISNARQEIGRDDRLMPAPHPDIVSYPQRAPAAKIAGRVISVYGGSLAGSRYSIIAVSRGKKDGVELGHVLALFGAGRQIEDRYRDVKTTVTLPEERKGLIYVFRVFDRVSYALIMQTSRQVEIGDAVRNP